MGPNDLIHTNQREELIKLYPNSASWKDRVKNMSEAQVTAIYLKKKNEGKLGK